MPRGVRGTGHWDEPTGPEGRGRVWRENRSQPSSRLGEQPSRPKPSMKSSFKAAVRKKMERKRGAQKNIGKLRTDLDFVKHELKSPAWKRRYDPNTGGYRGLTSSRVNTAGRAAARRGSEAILARRRRESEEYARTRGGRIRGR